MNISLAAEPVFYLNSIPITNSLLVTWILMIAIVLLGIFLKLTSWVVPNKIQGLLEVIYETSYKFVEDMLGKKITPHVYPLAITLLLFIAIGNLAGLLPGMGSLSVPLEKHGEIEWMPLFRAVTADLNMTFALALIAIVANQYFAIKFLGFGHYIKKFINFSSPINFFVGILEIISELSKILSFSFRLFGNVFAGEVLLAVMYFLVPFAVPIPFIMMEVFVGLMQAFVFFLLFIVFVKVSLAEH